MDTLWYFAYGSNISHDKFVGSRGIHPLAEAHVRLPGWALEMSIPGFPYREPAFASIQPGRDGHDGKQTIDVQGTAYLVTRAQYASIIASEGGGIAYREVVVWAEALHDEDVQHLGGQRIMVYTLTNAMTRIPQGRASMRYLHMITSAAEDIPFDEAYHKFLAALRPYTPPQTRKQKAGAAMFWLLWTPIITMMEKTIARTVDLDKGGNAPNWVAVLMRFVVAALWFSHDWVFAPLFGRGDGVDEAGLDYDLLDASRLPLPLPLPWTGC
ncbi:hypothetical protein ASPZODRAFT_17392 [Penicilliopsis zonata CBS 506.65]|uniref:gamma-glutamylcyclotransferase n=1 Tax=Penicilliopsis zonata CBS 506.65 TaxID=1073090 RepID=A0A1L9SFL7_9EURO|nr:hypothetical protein ASPZODRAFT_17392 [Penicilliopsis zonata CBS 506.65]OJJ45962.1 hypothetical protein ASPZODRAFT_17392 [Penicilliopsis zonata CBS 506.65]